VLQSIFKILSILASRFVEWNRRREVEAKAVRDAAIRSDPGPEWLRKFGPPEQPGPGHADNQTDLVQHNGDT